MPSFGYGVTGAAPYRRLTLVSFSQNSSAGAEPSGAVPASSSNGPRNGCLIPADVSPVASIVGLGWSTSHDHVLRNQAVGSTCSVSASGPALATEIAISKSSGPALA